jgi:hypothetical protein
MSDLTRKSVQFVSIGSLYPSEENIRKIEEILKKGYENVKNTKITTPGIYGYWVIGNYKNDRKVYSVSVDVSCEENDYGKVYVHGIEDRIENLKIELKNTLGIDFRSFDLKLWLEEKNKALKQLKIK